MSTSGIVITGWAAAQAAVVSGETPYKSDPSGDLTTTGTDPNTGGVPGNAYFYIANESDVGGSGGFIGSDATINLQAGSISTPDFLMSKSTTSVAAA